MADSQHRITMAAYDQQAQQLHRHLDLLSPRSMSPRSRQMTLPAMPVAQHCPWSREQMGLSGIASPRQFVLEPVASNLIRPILRPVPLNGLCSAPASPALSQRVVVAKPVPRMLASSQSSTILHSQ